MNRNYKCRYTEVLIHNNPAIYLENEIIRAGILTGKGCNIFEMLHKPTDTDILLRTKQGLDSFAGRDFAKEPARNYCEFYEGGWQDIIPLRAVWGEKYLGPESAGEAAAVAWNYRVTKNEEDEIVVRCDVKLPVSPLYIEKTFTVRSNDPALYINEKVRNIGDTPITFSWTHHPAFGGGFLEEGVKISLEAEGVLDYKKFIENAYPDESSHIYPIYAVPREDGEYADLTEVQGRQKDSACFYTLKNIFTEGVCLKNVQKGLAVKMHWDRHVFPHLWYWLENNKELYTLALEPSSTYLPHMCESPGKGVIALVPGEERTAWINISIEQIAAQ